MSADRALFVAAKFRHDQASFVEYEYEYLLLSLHLLLKIMFSLPDLELWCICPSLWIV